MPRFLLLAAAATALILPHAVVAAAPPAAFKTRVEAVWLDGDRFWYRNELPGGRQEFIYVDAQAKTRAEAFDARRLAEALAAANEEPVDANRMQLKILALDGESATVVFGDVLWRCDLNTYQIERLDAEASDFDLPSPPNDPPSRRRPERPSSVSPDGKLASSIRGGNLFVAEPPEDAKQLSHDGSDQYGYDRAFWSPDSKTIVAYRVRRGDHKPVYRLESSPKGPEGGRGGGAGRAVLHSNEYPLPGDTLDSYELNIFDVASGRQIKPAVDPIDMADHGGHPSPQIRWRPDGRCFLYEKYDRGHQRVRLIEVDAASGDVKEVLDERSETFIWSAHAELMGMRTFSYLEDGRRAIYASERSGWRHLYMLDIDSGDLQPITAGEWVVRGVPWIDEEKEQVWFAASGVYPGQDPYLVHYGRVNFDGSGLTWLTDADGNHELNFQGRSQSFSPDRKYYVVTHSRVDLPPVTELRRACDGERVLEVERAEVIGDWKPLEVFTAKGRDGETDIWGVIRRPADFDAAKQYPVVEHVYAGPHGAHVPKSFSLHTRYDSVAALGFVVVQADGMGTAMRSKAFHDVCWQNLADAGFPDRIAWIKAAAAERPYMDIDRVGIYGTSAGGQAAAGALIFHPEFYKVAVANCGCHDNRLDKISWNEQWMGYPVGSQYSASSNIDQAGRLRGHLQLVLGELDDNVPVESTYRLVDALIRADKEFEFVLVPGAGHGAGGSFAQRKLEDFLVRHLQGSEPAEAN